MATMVHAVILLNVQRDQINQVAERLAAVDGIAEVYSVAGQYDLAVIARTRDNDGLADLVTNHLLRETGVVRSETLIAFRVDSRYDLEHMFSVGMEESVPGRKK
jgi:DNA-binding Lrp family transcriptional regulator